MSGVARVAVYADLGYRRIQAGLYAEEAFALFAAALRDHIETVVLVGRLDGGSTRPYPHRLRDDVEFAGLPFYASLAAPAEVGRVAAASVVRFLRVLSRG